MPSRATTRPAPAAVDEINRDYAATPYAALATLIAARSQVESNELDKAAASLKTVMDTATDPELRVIARLRLARVQSAQGKYDDALATLKVEEPGEFAPRFADTRGDVLLAKGDRAGALREYLAARTGDDQGPGRHRTARSQDPRPRRHAAASAARKPDELPRSRAHGGDARARRLLLEGQEGRRARQAHRHQESHRPHPENLGRERGRRRQEAAPRPGPRGCRRAACSRPAATATSPRSTSRPASRSGARRRSCRSPAAPASAPISSWSARSTAR